MGYCALPELPVSSGRAFLCGGAVRQKGKNVSRKMTGKQDDEYLKGAWDWAADADRADTVGVRVVMVPTNRRGVWQLRVQACDVVDGKVVCVKVQHVIEFPGVSHQTLAGALLAGLLCLDHKLSQGTGLEQRPM